MILVVRRFAEYLQFERNYSNHTIRAYTTDVELFFEYLYPHQEIELAIRDVQTKDVRKWVMEQIQGGQTARTVNRCLSSLQLFFRFVNLIGLRKGNPVAGVSRQKIKKRLPAFLREEEVDQLMSVENFPEGWIGLRDRLLLLILYSAGLRRSELAALSWEDYDMRRQVFHIRGKGQKDRIVPVTAELAGLLEEYRRQTLAEWESSLLPVTPILLSNKGKPVSGGFIYSRVNLYFTLLPTCSCSGPHALRHTFATHMLNGGADVLSIKDLLGHSSLVSTQVYTHADIKQLANAYKGAHPRGGVDSGL